MGLCSRSQAAQWIHDGRVRLNGLVKNNPEIPVSLGRDRIEVDQRAAVAAPKIYVLLNKPRNIVTTARDEQGRATVYDLLPAGTSGQPASSWIAPVGRLDKASEGLLLLTNDSQWAARLAAPESHLSKTYHVQIAAVAGEALLASLRRGVASQGQILRAARVEILRLGERNSWLAIDLDEGKNRQIRRMLGRLGIEVLRLVRVAFGPLLLGDLAKGASRALTPAEKASMDRALAGRSSARHPH
jgi:23S rRNA pseudouridine2605 synthase